MRDILMRAVAGVCLLLTGALAMSEYVLKATPAQLDVWPGPNPAWHQLVKTVTVHDDPPPHPPVVIHEANPTAGIDAIAAGLNQKLQEGGPGRYCFTRTPGALVTGPLPTGATCPDDAWFSFMRQQQ